MKVLLTGITGNLGFEVARALQMRGAEIVPVMRDVSSLQLLGLGIKKAVEGNLFTGDIKADFGSVDCIFHCAGNVHFEKAGDTNFEMMRTVTKIAKRLGVPIFYVSTAFLWRAEGSEETLRNSYEKDKYHSEELLRESGVTHSIFRPSVLVGHSHTGKLRNWSGYYLLVSTFLEAAANGGNEKIRFPELTGTSNMLPVDQAATVIAEKIMEQHYGKLWYVTNPEPPPAQFVLGTTLESLGLAHRFECTPMGYDEYKKASKTQEEEILATAGRHFSPYWSLSYNFPESVCTENMITKKYLGKTLSCFTEARNFKVV